MKPILKKAISLLLSVIMLVPVCSVIASAAPEESENYYKGVFYYRPSTSELDAAADAFDVYTFSDDVFLKSGREYQDSLSTTSMALAVSSVSSTREPFTPEGYTRKNRNVIAFLEDNGFSDIAINDDYKLKPTKTSLGVACAHKTIHDGENAYPLLVIVPRSAGYEKEWGNNFVLGPSGDAAGFNSGAEKCLAFAKEYVAEHKLSGDIKVWVAGYSRGAAIANLIGKKLIDAPQEYLGDAIELTGENLYAYTFGTPSAAAKENNPRDPKYAGIFNSFSVTEISASMAPVDMGFERYGTDRILEDDENYETMLKYLSLCSAPIYNSYITTSGPKQFHPKKIVLIGDNSGIVNDDDSYIPNDIATYLRGLCTYMTEICGDRKTYAEKYEKSFSSLLGYYMSLTGSASSAFTNAFISNDDTFYLAAAMYAYFIRTQQTAKVSAADPQQLKGVAEQLAAISSAGDTAETGIDAIGIAKLVLKLLEYLTKSPEQLRGIAADYLASVLPPALIASGADEDDLADFSKQEDREALVHLLSHILFGNIWQSGNINSLNPNNELLKNAATLIGNFDNYFYDHYNEIIISRLKVSDARYETTEITQAQKRGYRRVVIDTDAMVNGVITDSEGNTVGTISNGVLTDTTDKWIGFTRCDDGDFFRVPIDDSYRISLTVSEGADLKAAVCEYDPYDAVAHPVYQSEVSAAATDEIIIDLPALDAEAELPSQAEYKLTVNRGRIRGDADGDGKVTVVDATAIQRMLASIPMAFFDEEAADCDGDEKVTILDATDIQRYLAGLPTTGQGIGEPIGQNG